MSFKYFLFLLTTWFTLSLSALEPCWVTPGDGAIAYRYLFAPGNCACETQAARYSAKFMASTGELVSCAVEKGIQVLGDQTVACNFAEISLKQPPFTEAKLAAGRLGRVLPAGLAAILLHQRYNHAGDSRLGTALLWGSLAAAGAYVFYNQINFLARKLENKTLGVTIATKPSPGPFSVAEHVVDLTKLNLGQTDDLAIYQDYIDAQTAADGKATKLILYGVSRGAATTLSGFAQLHHQPTKLAQIGAVICEAPFDSVVNLQTSSTGLNKFKLDLLLHSGITAFKADGPAPLALIAQITNQEIPILIITSQLDEIVFHANSLNLYRQLVATGHPRVHLLVLKQSLHRVYPSETEKARYQNLVHAFYRHYNLPHVPAWAELGQVDLLASQPTL